MPNGIACITRDLASPGRIVLPPEELCWPRADDPLGFPRSWRDCASPPAPWTPELRQCGGYLLCLHWPGWVAAIADQPFEFDAYAFRWAGLEADPVDVRF